MDKLGIKMDNTQLIEAQKKVVTKLMGFENFAKLDDGNKKLVLEFLKEYANMLHVEILRNYYSPEKPKPKEEMYGGRLHEEIPVAKTVGYMDKDKALAMCAENFKKCFGRELKLSV